MPQKHIFQSAKADDPDNTLVQSSDWNDNHVTALSISADYTMQANSSESVESDFEIGSGVFYEIASGSVFAIH
jgi:secreted protein with Ig-like and vWFA domain